MSDELDPIPGEESPDRAGAIMTSERWTALSKSEHLNLTEEEIKYGWHFCHEWDGLLVGPGMKEAEACLCFPEKRAACPPLRHE
jgi:hypothetical protein